MPAPSQTVDAEPLMSADQLAAALNLPQTWIETAPRQGELACNRAGRWIRYRRREVERALASTNQGARNQGLAGRVDSKIPSKHLA
jgi:hypothetical protein